MTKSARPSIRVEAGGDVNLSADEVGRDKITNQPEERQEEGKAGKKSAWDKVMSLVGTVPVLVKVMEFLGLTVK